jgi:hypothetical protein
MIMIVWCLVELDSVTVYLFDVFAIKFHEICVDCLMTPLCSMSIVSVIPIKKT